MPSSVTGVMDPGETRCTAYEVRDPQSVQTEPLRVGDIVDFDIVVDNPTHAAVTGFRTWLAYDSTVLEGQSIEINPKFPTPLPGEVDFSKTDGFVKISGSSTSSTNDEEIVLAHVKMKVIKDVAGGTPIVANDVTGLKTSKTAVFTKNALEDQNILPGPIGMLFVRSMDIPVASSSASSVMTMSSVASQNTIAATVTGGSSTSASAQSSVAPVPPSMLFTLLQVKGLRVTTEGSSVFLAWDPLPSTELVGYNVYYGTVSGRYIQKRGVEKSARTLTIRALPLNTTYYFSVRGINARDQETDYSQEVGVNIGKPETSTAPLTGTVDVGAPKTPKSNGSVSGKSGLPTGLAGFLVLTAIMATLLAFRRQLSAVTHL